jgi:carbon-monoxide dehydrogenase large subunit
MEIGSGEVIAGAYVGQNLQMKNAIEIVTGQARFVADIKLPGMVHMAVLRSPHAHARIREINVEEALSIPGVHLVLTGEQVSELMEPIPHYIDPGIVGGRRAEVYSLARSKVLYAGQPVAAVAAETGALARLACEKIKVDYELLPVVLSVEDALAEGAPRLIDGWEDNVMLHLRWAHPDVEGIFKKAPHVLKETIRIHRYSTQPIETRAYVANYDSREGVLTLYATAQNPHPLRTVLARALRMAENQIRVVVPNLGGAFGLKMHGHPEEPLVCLLSILLGRPVRWVEEREECLLIGGREQIHYIEVAFNDEGRILAMRDRFYGNVGAPSATPGWGMVFLTALTMAGPYDVQALDIEFSAVVTNKAPWNASRGYGKEATCIVLERIMDGVARALSMDPAEVRRRNFIPAEKMPYVSFPGLVIDTGEYARCLEKALDVIGYREWRRRQLDLRKEGRYVGVGIAYEMTPEGGAIPGTLVGGQDSSTVKVTPSGDVLVLTGVTDPGTGSRTAIAQIVAEELGVDAQLIRVIQGDTAACPYGFGNYSGRSTIAGGGAAALAARDVRERMARVAAVMLEAHAGELEFSGGRVHVRSDPRRSVSFREVAEAVYTRAYDVAADVEPNLEVTRTYRPAGIRHRPDEFNRINPYPSYSNGAYAAVVEVDVETGRVKVIDFAVVHDCGKAINPALVEAQMHGAVAMGIGAVLGEELVYDESGRLATQSFRDYLLPRAGDVPSVRVVHSPVPSRNLLLGMKGVGEAGVGGAAAAVIGAVEDALAPFKVRVLELPLKPPRVLRLIRGGEGGRGRVACDSR